MMRNIFYGIVFLLSTQISVAQSLPEVTLDEQWKAKIQSLAPQKTRFPSSKKKNVLVFSLHTGFKHWVIPHTEEMIKIIGEKSGSFTKNNCAPGGEGSTEVYTVPAGRHFSRESQAAADDLAQQDVNNNGLSTICFFSLIA